MPEYNARESRAYRRSLLRAWQAAWDAGERTRETNGKAEWGEEEIDAAAAELRRQLLGDEI